MPKKRRRARRTPAQLLLDANSVEAEADKALFDFTTQDNIVDSNGPIFREEALPGGGTKKVFLSENGEIDLGSEVIPNGTKIVPPLKPATKGDAKKVKVKKLEIKQKPERVEFDLDVFGDVTLDQMQDEPEAKEAPLQSEILSAIKGGDIDLANELISTGRNVASLASSFKKDLSPEALLADRLRARQQRRLGQRETNQLTGSGQFEGEKRSAFDLNENKFDKDLKSTRLLGQATDARRGRDLQTRALKNKMEVMTSNLSQLGMKIEVANNALKFAKTDKEDKELNSFLKEANAEKVSIANNRLSALKLAIEVSGDEPDGASNKNIRGLLKEYQSAVKDAEAQKLKGLGFKRQKLLNKGILKRRLKRRK